jgi:phosphopantothenoylcysteine decarboxylase/phosphopantothenate--cysteine ligase
MHFLITAGATREYIDPVRFISNASSGRMGFALAAAALKAGHKVTLITAPTAQQPPSRAKIIKAESAAQMFEAVKKHFRNSDCLIMAAAVSDYTPVKKSKIKIKKSNSGLVVRLKPTVDILAWAGKHKHERRATSNGPRFVVGFALEDKNLRANAERKLKEKNLDMIIANTPAAIGAEMSTVQIKTPQTKWLRLPQTDKAKVAKKIIALTEDITGHFCQD